MEANWLINESNTNVGMKKFGRYIELKIVWNVKKKQAMDPSTQDKY